jgi:ubiquinone/menaquinone biosynthesis C-methylase UbiE
MSNHILSQAKTSGGFMDPQKIVKSLGVDRDQVVADFGAGAGYFAIPLAKLVLPKGKVYAIDILPSAMEVLQKKADIENIANIEFIQADLENDHSTDISDSSVDLALVVNTLFQISNKANLFREAKRILKANGKLVVVDWAPGNIIVGPADAERVSPDQVRVAALINGFKEIKYWLPDAYHYGFVFVK